VNRLRAYREMEGLNQQELGELLSLSPQMVSAIESGRRSFTGDLAPLGYANERIVLPSMSAPLHRQRASTKVASKKRAQELLRLAGEVFSSLRERTPKTPQLALERLPAPSSLDEVEELAIEVRCSLDYDDEGPIRNLTTAVERAGVCVIPIVGLPGIDGLSSWVEGVPVIGLSPTVPGDRFRLTLGHEIGHLLLHRKRTDNVEHEANRFSGALLIPRAEFDAAMPERPQLRDFVNIKSAWGVSVAALVYRAHELDYIDDRRYRALQIQMSKWRKTEPGIFDPAYGQLLPRLVEVNGGVDRVASDLGVNRDHLAELVNWSHLRLA
jgi:Zn-dependent peptidase ImmA (M78 family)/transcriptional regulator with XRE-family HTH domain